MGKTPKDIPDERAELLTEINRAARRLGARSDLIGLISSWGDTLEDEDVLDGLRNWNSHRPVTPDDRPQPTTEDARMVEAALAKLTAAGPSREPAAGMTVEHAIQNEICRAFKSLGAPVELLAPLSSWGDTYSDAETLLDLRRFNRTGTIFDATDVDLTKE